MAAAAGGILPPSHAGQDAAGATPPHRNCGKRRSSCWAPWRSWSTPLTRPSAMKKSTTSSRVSRGRAWGIGAVSFACSCRAWPTAATSGSRPFGRSSTTSRATICRAATGLWAKIDAIVQNSQEEARLKVELRNLLDAIVSLRNKETGHGALGARGAEFYDGLSQAMLGAAAKCFPSSIFSPGDGWCTWSIFAGCRRARGESNAGAAGLASKPLEPLELPSNAAATLPHTQRIFLHPPSLDLQDPAGLHPSQSLYPLALYDETADDLLMINGRTGKRATSSISATSAACRSGR